MAGAKVAAPAASPAKAKTHDVVVEYVLRDHKSDEVVQPLLSDHDLDVIQHARIDAIHQARKEGRARPDLRIAKRVCTYPLGAKNQRLAEGSTCEETEVQS